MDVLLSSSLLFTQVTATERALIRRTVRAYFALLHVHQPRRPRYATERYGAGLPRPAAPMLG
jgi:hypothetical protein